MSWIRKCIWTAGINITCFNMNDSYNKHPQLSTSLPPPPPLGVIEDFMLLQFIDSQSLQSLAWQFRCTSELIILLSAALSSKIIPNLYQIQNLYKIVANVLN